MARSAIRMLTLCLAFSQIPAAIGQDAGEDAIGRILEEAQALQLERPADAAAMARRALERLADEGDPTLRIKAMSIAARAYSRTGDYAAALDFGGKAIALADAERVRNDLLATALDAVAEAHQRLGQFAEAYLALQRGYAIRRTLGREEEMLTSLTNMATLEAIAGEYDRSLVSFAEARPLAERLGRKVTLGRILINTSYSLMESGRAAEAVEVLEEARELAIAEDNDLLKAHSFHNTGEALVLLGRIEEAEPYLERAEVLAEQLGLKSVLSDNHLNLGQVALARGNHEVAREHARRALALAEEMGEAHRLRDIHYLLFEIAEAEGRLEEAVGHLEHHLRLKDEVFNRESDRRRALLQAQFGVTEKEQRIELLEREAEIKALRLAREEFLGSVAIAGIVFAFFVIAVLAYLLRARSAALRALGERTRELTKTRNALAEAGRAKSNLLAVTSHEVRTPLNGMLGMAQLLEKTTLESSQRRYVETILAAGRALLTILNDILDFSRIEAGQVEIHPAPFSVRELVEVQADMWRAQAEAKGLGFDVDIAPEIPERVIADPNRVQQILVNLLSNAFKFTREGGVRLSVAGAGEDESGRLRLRFEVADTGGGIPEDLCGRIFEPYNQGRNAADGSQHGTGLGLFICKELVERMGGFIAVDSAVGEGSVFRFEIPVEWAPEEESRPPRPQGADERHPAGTEGMRILVAEDNEINQRLLEAILGNWGYEFVIAGNGRIAVERANAEVFDLILMDARMPEMSGIEAARAIRAGQGPCADVPIVALTANALEGDAEAFAAAGMDGYLTKPIDLATLAAEIDRLVSRTAAGARKRARS